MNHWNSVENRLRSWTPRSPSAKLRRRLFGKDTGGESAAPDLFAGYRVWIAPAMGCSFMLMVLSGMHGGQLGYLAAGSGTNFLGLAASNQAYAAYLGSEFHSEQNSPQCSPVQWTIGHSETTQVGLFAMTNSLNR